MKTLTLTQTQEPDVLSELRITPTTVAGLSLDEVAELEVKHGNRDATVGDFFDVSGETTEEHEEQEIVVEGDCTRLKSIGRGMTAGKVVIRGDAGLYTGAEMRGGELTVEGDVADWCGAEKAGGDILVKGDAGAYLGGAYRGSRKGMHGGRIRVEGSVGNECGSWLQEGSIRITGDVGKMLGIHMAGGDIHVEGDVGRYVGGAMTGGRILVDGDVVPMPTFTQGGEEDHEDVSYLRYLGDAAENGKGEVMVRT